MQASIKAPHLLSIFHSLNLKYGKDYCFPSQEKLLDLLARFRRCKISRATLNRWLSVLEDQKYILRYRRLKHHQIYGMVFHSTLYKITVKGVYFLRAVGVDMRFELSKLRSWLAKKTRPKDEYWRARRPGKGETHISEIIKTFALGVGHDSS